MGQACEAGEAPVAAGTCPLSRHKLRALAVGLGYPLQEPCPVSPQLGARSHPDAFKNVGVGSSELGAAELLYSLKENYPSLEDLL